MRMNAKNLLFLSSYTDLGGGETALLTLARQLDPQRYQPHLLVPREGQLSHAWRKQGWPVHVRPYRGASTWFIPALWAHLPLRDQVEALIREQDIHALHSDYHSLPMALPAAEACHIPALWTCMGWWFRPKAWQRGFFQRSAVTFAHSEAIKAGFLGEPPFMPAERVAVMYPGVDTARFSPYEDAHALRAEIGIAANAPVVAMVARFQDVKGHEVFQAMAKAILQRFPHVHFVVAGENTQTHADDTYKQRILAAGKTPPLKDHLHYLGFRADVERVYAMADIAVCASHFESYGLANVEAMACGLPVVSTNQGGPAETVVDGETGYLVPPGDGLLLASRVMLLLQDAALRKAMGKAGRSRVEQHFSARANRDQFTQALNALGL
jgi:glycosyltransferase involved in cell wall biosynthesis